MNGPDELDEDRLQELIDQGEELDEDERAELGELRSQARSEKQAAKMLAKFDKARVVFRVVDPDDGDFYMLDLATAQKWAGKHNIEQVERKALVGKVTIGTMEGFYGDGDNWGRDEVYGVTP